jgi:hypothetical protein
MADDRTYVARSWNAWLATAPGANYNDKNHTRETKLGLIRVFPEVRRPQEIPAAHYSLFTNHTFLHTVRTTL